MNRSPEASLASINMGINHLKSQVEVLVAEGTTGDVQAVLIDVTGRPLDLMEIPDYRNKTTEANRDLIEAELELLKQYNEFKGMLHGLLKMGWQLDILGFEEVCRKLGEQLHIQERASKPSLLTDYSHGFPYSGSFPTTYTLWLFWEFVNYWDQRKFAYQKLQASIQLVAAWVRKFRGEIIQNHFQAVLDNVQPSLESNIEEQLKSQSGREEVEVARIMSDFRKFKHVLKEIGWKPPSPISYESFRRLSEALNEAHSPSMGYISEKDIYRYLSWVLNGMDELLTESWELWGPRLNEDH